MKSAKSSYEDERAFQAAHAANEILSNVNDKYSGSSPYSNSGPGSIHNEYDCLLPGNSRPVSHGGLTPQSGPISNPDSYLYVPNAAGNYITDDVIPQRRSTARRIFSITCIFDMLLVSILWTIIAINHYGGLNTAWDIAIKNFKFNQSMADLMLLSLGRSTCLITHYWIIVSQLQITIALTTTISTIYIFLKLIIFQRDSAWNNFETYALLLISFLLCWIEVWMFESKVLKAENQVSRYLRPRYPDARTPLLGPAVNSAGSDFNYSAFVTPSATIPPTPGGDLHQIEANNLDPRGQMMYNVALEAHSELKETVLWPDGWTTELDKDGIKVFSRAQRRAPNRLFLSESHFLCSLEDLFEVLYHQMDSVSEWNSSILEVQMLERFTQHLDLLYTVGVGGGAGLIKSRDFLTLRYWSKERDMYFIVSRDVNDPIKPPSKFPRGFNGPCGYVFFPALDGSVKLTYVINCDLKLPLVPQKVITSSLVEVVHGFHMTLRNKMDDYVDSKRRQSMYSGNT
ncbi:stAR-related lipid transfer protein 3-like isoform X3 [Bolinopsis microptera]|uniref:stAR-related lipid transfer protein 3-like isoform X3 n=1 Tax=Bolinopsis microptera TaxID=2820187 RepID=UPI003079E426